jgi:hypothetical protein
MHLEMINYNSSAYAVQLSYGYGTMDANGVYTQGQASQPAWAIISGAQLDTFSTQMANANEPALPAAIRLGYQFLMQNGIAGTLNYALPNSQAPSSIPSAATVGATSTVVTSAAGTTPAGTSTTGATTAAGTTPAGTTTAGVTTASGTTPAGTSTSGTTPAGTGTATTTPAGTTP